MAVEINAKACIGCGICVDTCPVQALSLVDGVSVVDPKQCVDCGACVKVCPTNAITLDKPLAAQKKQPATPAEPAVKKAAPAAEGDYQGVWVFVEQMEGEAAPVSWELMGEGRKLADKLGVELAGVILGAQAEHLVPEAFAYGADKVYIIDDPVLARYRTEPYLHGLVKLIRQYRPEIVLMGATTLGRDLSGTVATELRTGLTADCTVLDINPETRLLEQTRPAFGGNIMATILCRTRRPQMATVRPRVMAMPPRQEGRSGQVIREELGLKEEEIQTKVLEYITAGAAGVYLDKAEIIVAGGRGVGAKNWPLLEELAQVLGGTVGASRAAVEAGWASPAQQVGQTGYTVRPKVYFAVGISGAIQHLVGMQTSDTIVAINNDANAPIFKIADYGIVGDAAQILPALVENFKQQLAGRR
ncbi:electron transfer flavoprotein alpha subunit apoprotein [Carboxydocella thermautotrophica]|nr:electron transfer flavoprotein alpha subunit apoprotein [Carboxydocella thermautotrophica]